MFAYLFAKQPVGRVTPIERDFLSIRSALPPFPVFAHEQNSNIITEISAKTTSTSTAYLLHFLHFLLQQMCVSEARQLHLEVSFLLNQRHDLLTSIEGNTHTGARVI